MKTNRPVKKAACTLFLILLFPALTTAAITALPFPAHADDTSATFTEKFNALTPPPNSSVHSDYLFEQIALGSQYTVTLLDRLNTSSDHTNTKLDNLLEKFELLMEQNQKIIDLLEKQQSPE
jgi:hypothetical protein